MAGRVVGIYTAQKGEKPQPLDKATLVAGRGIIGDRYYEGEGTFSRQLADNPKREITLIASEEVEKFNRLQNASLEAGDFRRNIITRDIDLNGLVGKRFSIAGVQFEGLETCEPCAHLARTVHPAVLPGLVNRAGLRAAILADGLISVGDEISFTQA